MIDTMMTKLAETTPIDEIIGRLMSGCLKCVDSNESKQDLNVLAFACSMLIIKHAQVNGESSKGILKTMEEFSEFKDIKQQMMDG